MAAAAIWLDPARATLGYGQVTSSWPRQCCTTWRCPGTCRWKGAAIGLAAGIKITPAIFVAYLLLTRQYRAAVTAAAVFARDGRGRVRRAPGQFGVVLGR